MYFCRGGFYFPAVQTYGSDDDGDRTDDGGSKIGEAHAVDEGVFLSGGVGGDMCSELLAHAAVEEGGRECDAADHAEITGEGVDAAADAEFVTGDRGHGERGVRRLEVGVAKGEDGNENAHDDEGCVLREGGHEEYASEGYDESGQGQNLGADFIGQVAAQGRGNGHDKGHDAHQETCGARGEPAYVLEIEGLQDGAAEEDDIAQEGADDADGEPLVFEYGEIKERRAAFLFDAEKH